MPKVTQHRQGYPSCVLPYELAPNLTSKPDPTRPGYSHFRAETLFSEAPSERCD